MASTPVWQHRALLRCTADNNAPTVWRCQASHRWGACKTSTQTHANSHPPTWVHTWHTSSLTKPGKDLVCLRKFGGSFPLRAASRRCFALTRSLLAYINAQISSASLHIPGHRGSSVRWGTAQIAEVYRCCWRKCFWQASADNRVGVQPG